MTRSAYEILEDIGSPKSSTSKRRVGIRSKKSALLEEISKDTKKISRAVMRYPVDEVLEQLQYTHQRMAEEFASMSDESLTWLLGGSSEMARGGFQDSPTKTAAQKFREFLETDPKTIPPQRLITGIETIGTAMGYRAIKASWVEPPFIPETPDQKLIYEKISEIMLNKLTRPIGEIYTARFKDDLAVNPSGGSREIIGQPEDVSSASENEEEDHIPRKKIDLRKYRNEVRPGYYSWIGAAVAGGIDVRGHTSGTCPLTLAAIDGLCSTGNGPQKKWLEDNSNFNALAGALTIATFQRGDYHSIAETAAGVNHYLVERAIKHGEDVENIPMQPYDAFKYGMSMLVQASSTKKALESDQLSIRDAILESAKSVIHKTKRLTASMIEFNPKRTQEFYENKAAALTFSYKEKVRAAKEATEKNDPDENEKGYEGDDESDTKIKDSSGYKY